MNWIIDKLLDRLEPRLEKLVRASVDEAVTSIADEIDQHLAGIPEQILTALRSLPIIGGLIQ